MLGLAMVVALLAPLSAAYALNNSDLLQLNALMSLQQQKRERGLPRLDMVQMMEPLGQTKLRQQNYLRELMGTRQQEQIRREHYRQEVLWEWQRRGDARRLGAERLRDMLMEREQSGLFR